MSLCDNFLWKYTCTQLRKKYELIIDPHLKSLTFHSRREAGNDVHPLGNFRLGADVRLNIRRKDQLLVLDGEGLDRFRDPKKYMSPIP